jgi:CBS domain-containing protein
MGLFKNMQNEPVSRLALREAVCARPASSVREAVQRMREKHLGCVIVVDADTKPLGMFTEAMLRQLLVENPGALNDRIETRMATQFPWTTITDPVATVLEAMQLKNYRFVCVCDAEGRVVGLTGQKGLVEYVAEHFPQQVMTQDIRSHMPQAKREGA